jgi:hypothetical protein
MAAMKKDSMFKHKEVTIIYEENMGDVNDYQFFLNHL